MPLWEENKKRGLAGAEVTPLRSCSPSWYSWGGSCRAATCPPRRSWGAAPSPPTTSDMVVIFSWRQESYGVSKNMTPVLSTDKSSIHNYPLAYPVPATVLIIFLTCVSFVCYNNIFYMNVYLSYFRSVLPIFCLLWNYYLAVGVLLTFCLPCTSSVYPAS